MLKHLREQLKKLLEERAALVTAFEATAATATTENRALTDAEQPAYDAARAALKAHDDNIVAVRARVADAEADEARAAAVAAIAAEVKPDENRSGGSGAKVGNEPRTYRKGGKNSYFRDLTLAGIHNSSAAIERLQRNDTEVRVDVEQRARQDANFEARALTTTDGGVGEFVPPLWMVDQYVELARAGRVIADQIAQQPLPAGTDSINLPRLATGTATAEQATQNTAVQNTDATSNSVTATVATIAGQQVLAVQLIEQSPINMDEILLADLAADYAVKLDTFVISNNAAGKRGLLNVTGINAVTFTTPVTVAGAYPKVADAIQQIHTGRFMPPDKIFMHPRRWAWMLASLDSSGRPLVVPYAAMNPIAETGGVVSQGLVGTLQGLPVYVDPNIPINLGAGTNEDRIIGLKSNDIILFEGTPRAEAFRETKADQLSVLLRFYNYAALHSERYPKAISVIAGAGLVTPTF